MRNPLKSKWMWGGALASFGSYLAIRSGLSLPIEQVVQGVLCVSVVVLISQGADWLVNAACRIAQAIGVSHLAIGLTVVAFGTSAPEVAASLVAGFQGKGDITIANVVGSNVFNICFILGGVALIVSGGLRVTRPLIVRDGPILLLASLLLFLFVGGNPFADAPVALEPATFWPSPLNLRLEAGEGVILLACLLAYIAYLYKSERGRDDAETEEERRMTEETFGLVTWTDGPLLLLGLVAVVGGCNVLVGQAEVVDGRVIGYGALWFARLWEVPDWVIGVTVIAAGTSAPELVVSLVAAMRGAFGLSAGNLLGSDIFNMFGVVGLAGVLLQPPLGETVVVSSAVVPGLIGLGVTVLLLIVFMRSGMRVSAKEGAVLLLLGVGRWVLDFSMR
jgi:cation:H+ antiporter